MRKNMRSDFNVHIKVESCAANLRLLRALADAGYERVALCHHVTLSRGVQLRPAPELADLVEGDTSHQDRQEDDCLAEIDGDSGGPCPPAHSVLPAADTYDLLSVCPASDRVFLQACSTLPIDIVAVNLADKLPFTLRYSQLSQAVERGLFLEISYSPALRGSSARKCTITNAQELVKGCGGKNVVVSSDAEMPLEVRPPLDVVNMCRLFGLTDVQCKAAVTTASRAVLIHANMRRHSAKAVVSCQPVSAPAVRKRATETADREPPAKKLRGTQHS